MKKYLSLVLAAVIAISACGCASSSVSPSEGTGAGESGSTSVTTTAAKADESSVPAEAKGEGVSSDTEKTTAEAKEERVPAAAEQDNAAVDNKNAYDETAVIPANTGDRAELISTETEEAPEIQDPAELSWLSKAKDTWTLTTINDVDFIEYAEQKGRYDFYEYPVIEISDKLTVKLCGEEMVYGYDIREDAIQPYVYNNDLTKKYFVSIRYVLESDILVILDGDDRADMERGIIQTEKPAETAEADEPKWLAQIKGTWSMTKYNGMDFIRYSSEYNEEAPAEYPVIVIDDMVTVRYDGQEIIHYYDITDEEIRLYRYDNNEKFYGTVVRYNPENDTLIATDDDETGVLERGIYKPEVTATKPELDPAHKELLQKVRGSWTFTEANGKDILEYFEENGMPADVYPTIYISGNQIAVQYNGEYQTDDYEFNNGIIEIYSSALIYQPETDTIKCTMLNGSSDDYFLLKRGKIQPDGSFDTYDLLSELEGDWTATSVKGMTFADFEQLADMDLTLGMCCHFENGDFYMSYNGEDTSGMYIVDKNEILMLGRNSDDVIGRVVYDKEKDILSVADTSTFDSNGEVVEIIFERGKIDVSDIP